MEEEDKDLRLGITYNDLKTRCRALGLRATGTAEKLRQRLQNHNEQDLSDIDEESERESIISLRRNRGRSRSVDKGSRRLSDLSSGSSLVEGEVMGLKDVEVNLLLELQLQLMTSCRRIQIPTTKEVHH
jgi:hypothetical protein